LCCRSAFKVFRCRCRLPGAAGAVRLFGVVISRGSVFPPTFSSVPFLSRHSSFLPGAACFSSLSFVAASWLFCHLLVVFSELRVSIFFFTGSSAALTSSLEDWKISPFSSDLLFTSRQPDFLHSRYRFSSQGSSSPEFTNKKHHGDSKLSRVEEKIPFSVPFAATAVCD
jgi:hypothetical protein